MVCFSLTTARLSNWPLTVGSAPKPSIRRLLIVEQWSVDPWRLAPRTISWSFLLISSEIIYTKVKYLAGKWKSREIGVARRNDLDVFGCAGLIKFEWAERFMFLRAHLRLNRCKFSAEREGIRLRRLFIDYQILVGLLVTRSRIWRLAENIGVLSVQI